ncbi:hypothetical protein [Lentzea californiensis]|uniref:hypothetical protein n=1 Tax=Lentzea californiensis TaxID=438851 RepID=UPI0021648893|nr:hypothetical protein [Lentzea californiensis]MCR3747263.1 hypothetical protein [Lentzea californiensis]
MKLQIVVVPLDEEVGSKLDEAPGWPEYARELRELFSIAIEASGVEVFEVGGLTVHEPLPDEFSWLRNGAGVPAAQAADLYTAAVGRGSSPLFVLVSDALRIELSWNGWVFMPTSQDVFDAVDGVEWTHLDVGWRPPEPDTSQEEAVVESVTDEKFWSAVRAAAQNGTTLLSERWAFGVRGSRWFLVTPENADEVISAMRPRSLVSVAVEPDLRVHLLDRGFTAFGAPLAPGELVYRELPFGVDDEAELAEVTGAGFDLFLADAALAELYAVVPDADGVARMEWDDPKQLL